MAAIVAGCILLHDKISVNPKLLVSWIRILILFVIAIDYN